MRCQRYMAGCTARLICDRFSRLAACLTCQRGATVATHVRLDVSSTRPERESGSGEEHRWNAFQMR